MSLYKMKLSIQRVKFLQIAYFIKQTKISIITVAESELAFGTTVKLSKYLTYSMNCEIVKDGTFVNQHINAFQLDYFLYKTGNFKNTTFLFF